MQPGLFRSGFGDFDRLNAVEAYSPARQHTAPDRDQVTASKWPQVDSTAKNHTAAEAVLGQGWGIMNHVGAVDDFHLAGDPAIIFRMTDLVQVPGVDLAGVGAVRGFSFG